MGQFSFFDADKRLAAISAKGDPLEMIDRVVPFESFRAEIEAAVLTPAREKKSNAGRKPIDVIVMFRMLVLQSLYNLSDEQVEYQVLDRLSFTRFLPTAYQFARNAIDHVYRDRKAYPGRRPGTGDDRAGDANQPTGAVEQRTAGIARIDRRVGLDDAADLVGCGGRQPPM
jgi:hypothetical protein